MTDHPAKGRPKRQIEVFEKIAVGQDGGHPRQTLEALERAGVEVTANRTSPPDVRREHSMSSADKHYAKVLERWRRMCRHPGFVRVHRPAFDRRAAKNSDRRGLFEAEPRGIVAPTAGG